MIVQANYIRQRLGKSWRILRCISEIEITGMRCRRGEEGSDWSSEYCVDMCSGMGMRSRVVAVV